MDEAAAARGLHPSTANNPQRPNHAGLYRLFLVGLSAKQVGYRDDATHQDVHDAGEGEKGVVHRLRTRIQTTRGDAACRMNRAAVSDSSALPSNL
ncbi:hypothetical protein EYF80_042027 [Liparis tanakae]|uniref:Uncharacterized protein n=1 Tax=Liparis tanakae TaxID=230148 RepID=A0A4Z2G4Q9_9TELE|nr:hypothetical protein EYF80_042027 [Liparis tanakae]